MIRVKSQEYLCGICKTQWVVASLARLCEDRCLDKEGS